MRDLPQGNGFEPVRTLGEEQQLAVIEAALRRGYGTTHRSEEQDT